MSNDIAPISTIPAHLQGKTKTVRIGNIDQSDLVIPRIKLLSKVNPEVDSFDDAKAGEFWHANNKQSLGTELIGVPIVTRKTYVLWSPRGMEGGILARSTDAIHWDPPEGEFHVRFKGDSREYTWKLAPTVAESRLDQFGSSRNDFDMPMGKRSPPAAALTYETLWWFLNRPDVGRAIVLNSRGSVKVCQEWLTSVDEKPLVHYYQVYSIGIRLDKGGGGEQYYNYQYRHVGYTNPDDSEFAHQMYEHFKDVPFRASDEREDDAGKFSGNGSGRSDTIRTSDTKF